MDRDEQGPIHPSSDAAPGPGADEDRAPAPEERIEAHHLLDPWSDREEVRAVPEILRPAEELVAVGSGAVVRTGRLAQSKWLVVLTDRRLLCIKGRKPATRNVIDMPVAQIREVETAGLVRKTLSLDTGYGTLRIGGLTKPVAAEMVRGITGLMGAHAEGGAEPGAPTPSVATAATGSDAPASKGAPEPGARGHTSEQLRVLEETVGRLEGTIGELTDRVAFLEELVRSNVADPSEDMEVPT